MRNLSIQPVFLDISGAINSAIGDVKSQIKSIMNVVFQERPLPVKLMTPLSV